MDTNTDERFRPAVLEALARLEQNVADLDGKIDTLIDVLTQDPPDDPPDEPPLRFLGIKDKALWGESTDGDCPGQESDPHDPIGLEDLIDDTVDCFRSYWHPGEEDAAIAVANRDLSYDRLPILSFKTPDRWNTPATFAFIDMLMARLATEVKGYVVLILHHEPYDDTDGFGGESANRGTRADHVAMSRYAMSVCAPNVTYAVNVQGFPFNPNFLPPGDPQKILDWYRDADGPVCHVATINGYDQFYVGGKPPRRTPEQVHGPILDAMEELGVPLGICEWGVRHDPKNPSSKYDYYKAEFEMACNRGLIFMCQFNCTLNSPNGPWWQTEIVNGEWETGGQDAFIECAHDARAGHLSDLG